MAEVKRVRPNLYEVQPHNDTEYAPVAFYATAQDLYDICDWCLRHIEELECDLKRIPHSTVPKPWMEVRDGG